MSAIKDVLTTQQAAKLLGVSTTSVQKMVTHGELTAWVTPGGHRRIFRAAVENLLQSSPALGPGVVGPHSLRVLVVEDSSLPMNQFKSLIARCGHSVKLIMAGGLALDGTQVAAFAPHLLVMHWPRERQGDSLLLQDLLAAQRRRGMLAMVLTESGREDRLTDVLPDWVVHYPRSCAPERLAGYLDALASSTMVRCEPEAITAGWGV